MPLQSATDSYTDSRGYSYVDCSEWWAEQCSILPCFAALHWPNYDTKIIEDTIDGHPVVIQLWKGRCDQLLGPRMPGGIGAEVGIYRRITNKTIPSNIPDWYKPLLNAALATGADLWWPYLELRPHVEFELINPRNNASFFRTGPKVGAFGYWLTRWMHIPSYNQYKQDNIHPELAHEFWMVTTVNGKKYLWGPPELADRYAVHVAGVTSDGHLWHTIRRFNDSWDSFGDVEGQTGDCGDVADVDLVRSGNDVHLCAVTAAGGLRYTVRRSDGSWQAFADLEAKVGERGSFRRVSLAVIGNTLFILGVTSDGRIWHASRTQKLLFSFPTITWSSFEDVETIAGERGSFVDVDCSIVDGLLHVCGVTSDGHLWHSIRRADGTWQDFGDVEGAAGDRGTIQEVACAGIRGELHVCAVSSDGHLWHTIRRANGAWQPFGDVEGSGVDRGAFVRVSAGDCDGALHVCGVTSDGQLWHAIRYANGSWRPLMNVEARAGERGSFTTVSVDGIEPI